MLAEIDFVEQCLAYEVYLTTGLRVDNLYNGLQRIDIDAPLPARQLALRGLLAVIRYLHRHLEVWKSAHAARQNVRLAASVSAEEHVGALLLQGDLANSHCDAGLVTQCAEKILALGVPLSPTQRARVWFLFGGALTRAGLYEQADARLVRALEELGDEAEPRIRSYTWTARVVLEPYLSDESYRRSRHACDQAVQYALEVVEQFGERGLAANAYCNRACLEMLCGDLDAAAMAIDKAQDYSSQSQRTALAVSAVRALLEVRRSNSEHARADMDAAMRRLADTPALLEPVVNMLASIYLVMGELDHVERPFIQMTKLRAATLRSLVRGPTATPPDGAGDGRGDGGNHPDDLSSSTPHAFNFATWDLLERLAVAAELRDDETGKHCQRVGQLSSRLARSAGQNEAFCETIERAARLHDLGKFAIPDAILLKPGPLNAVERRVMEQHAAIGADLLDMESGLAFQVAAQIARHHHERWDGSGYPAHLSGEAIPLVARIVCIADVYDALTHRRPYKPAWSAESALAYMTEQAGKQFDPQLMSLFANQLQVSGGG
jgi:HD-GYP domain-containing protein (c-di-GMP phosphodiesterase class II)